ncbi:MAG: vitamin B12 dependent methionine synthase [Dehalococcoidia bacterium]|nr:vitamin B12 dependent methionine synthase [Dehalococcoidia bacterium]
MTETARNTDAKVFDSIPVKVETEDVLRIMKARKNTPTLTRIVDELVAESIKIAKPKSMYKVCYVQHRSENTVTLDGHTFQSSVLRQNLEGIERVFPFVATCGTEMDAIQPSSQDMLAAYCWDAIRLILVNTARRHAEKHLKETYLLRQLSRMAPGSLEDWPLPEQGPLFDLLGDATKQIGVTLTDRFLMIPVKSVSGVFFPTEVRFENCQLCQRANCTGRRAPYSAEVSARYGV